MQDDIEISRAVNLSIRKHNVVNLTEMSSQENVHDLVNYIRHNLTDYDKEMERFSSPVAARIYKKRVLEHISKWFPDLKIACEQQIRNLNK